MASDIERSARARRVVALQNEQAVTVLAWSMRSELVTLVRVDVRDSVGQCVPDGLHAATWILADEMFDSALPPEVEFESVTSGPVDLGE
jgi:hypothetical protein